MFFSPYKTMFFLTLLSGTVLSISSSSWLLAWIGLELNLMSFIPLISSKTNLISSEAALKYFLVQALGSAIIVLASSMLSVSTEFASLAISLALLLKMGASPFHFWFPQVMEGMNWLQATLLMTIQKLAPMFLISYLTFSVFCWTTIAIAASFSAIVGAIGGLNQTSLRKILAFSSINHMSWMLFSMLINETSWFIYFMLYSLITMSVTMLFFSFQAYYFSNLINAQCPTLSKTISMMALFSLGGLPPFSGFIPKWIVVQEMISHSYFHILILLLFSSLITLYFYIRLSISSVTLSHPQNKWAKDYSRDTSFSKIIFYFLNLFGLLVPSLLFIL
uniref:NADH-ubiquinone oxidoreductase chain 2 n=1 Tax=Gramastacus insolitus TaxID=99772 RepID=A0A191TEC7_9EUCA|nr:NADH dehydrogenase subunit 2 [Gramastacus insolitus]ANI86977.1 NADH dehydrogenase subunit 2 [Gramastacus insolitus]